MSKPANDNADTVRRLGSPSPLAKSMFGLANVLARANGAKPQESGR